MHSAAGQDLVGPILEGLPQEQDGVGATPTEQPQEQPVAQQEADPHQEVAAAEEVEDPNQQTAEQLIGFNGCWDMGPKADSKRQADMFATAFKFKCTGPNCTRYTSRVCTGSFAKNRMCRFRNIYYNMALKRFEYFTCPSDSKTAIVFGHSHWSADFQLNATRHEAPWQDGHLEEDFLLVSRFGKNPDFARMHATPPPASQVYAIPDLTVIWQGNKMGAYGHFWIDNVYPILLMLDNLQALTRDFTLFYQPEPGDTSYLDTIETYFPAVSSKPVYIWPQMTESITTPYIRFDELIIGGAFFGLNTVVDNRDKGGAPTFVLSRFWWQLRAHVYEGLGMDPNVKASAHKIVINGYSFKRALVNREELAVCLGDRFPGVPVDVINFAPLTFTEQTEIMQRTTLFITTEGGAGYRYMFMPRGSTAVVISSPVATISSKQRFSPFHELDRFFAAVEYLNFATYSVGVKDTSQYDTRYQAPPAVADRLSKDQLQMYNMYNSDIIVDCQRMGDIVQTAIYEMNLLRAYGLS